MRRIWAVWLLAAWWLAGTGWLLCAPPPAAIDPAAPFGPADAVRLARADAEALAGALAASGQNPHDVQGYRYFYFNSDAAELPSRRAAFQLAVNLLSRYSEPVKPHYLHPRLCRVDADEPGWDRAVFEAAQHTDVFFYKREELDRPARFRFYWPGGADTRGPDRGKRFRKGVYEADFAAGQKAPLAGGWLPAAELSRLQELLHAQVPVLNAEWMLVQSARQISLRNKDDEGLGYYDFWRIQNRDDFFKIVAFNKTAAEHLKRVKAAQEFSGVSPTPRQFVRDTSQSGCLWVALDVLQAAGDGVAIRQLKDGQLRHKIEEWYGCTPFGLPLTPLFNDEGKRQNNAPGDAAGFGDDSPLNEGRDRRIHPNLSCLGCHAGQVLKPIDDYVRKTYLDRAALGDPDKAEALKLKRQYFADLQGALGRDRDDYRRAFRAATVTADYPAGLDAQKAVEAYCRAFHAYASDPVTLAVAARELGVSESHFEAKLLWLATEVKILDARLAPLVRLGKKPSLPISRLTWEDSYELAQEVAQGIIPKLRKP